MRKECLKYIFTVEGETEEWYFKWLQNAINSSDAIYKVKFDCKPRKDPVKLVKGLSIPTEITHVIDRESEDPYHVRCFEDALDRMSEAQKLKRNVKYKLGYSNFTFELWMILHKQNCNGCLTDRRQYLRQLNNAYNETFRNLDEYKRESNFKKVLERLTLNDVKSAVQRSKEIEQRLVENGHTLHKHKGYTYYRENPSLSIGKIIGDILKECRLS